MSGYPGILLTGPGTSPPIKIAPFKISGWHAAPSYALGLYLTFSPGAVLTATVQVCAHPDPFDPAATFNNHEFLNVISSQNSNISFPVSGVRLVVPFWLSGTASLGIASWPY
jgi:hypothetical protein